MHSDFSLNKCSVDHERDWPPCKVLVVFFGLATNALNVRNNENNIISRPRSTYRIGNHVPGSILAVNTC